MKDFLKKIPKRAWIYAGAALAALLAVTLPLALTGTQNVLYSIFWGILGGIAALIVARTIYHCATGDNTAEMWSVSIYGLAADLGWLIGILSTTWAVAIIGIVVMIVGAMMSLCMRYGDRDGTKTKREELLLKMKQSLRYRFMGDDISGMLDTRRWLVEVENAKEPMTINEAIANGHTEEAKAAEEYLNGVLDRYVAAQKEKK